MDSGGRRPLSSGSSNRGSDSLYSVPEETVDYLTNPDQYFSDLLRLSKHAQRVLQKEDEEEAKLVNFLPLVERTNLNKEGKVLTRWQERQREWERVQSVVSKKISSKVERPLMMTTTDEYRARMEEYDLIQAAIPIKDRHANSAWEMSLRGGGPIRVPVGHIFSGLECEIDPILPKPKIVRKPKDPLSAGTTDTFVPRTKAYQSRRKQLLKSITEMRPRDITFKDASALVIKSVDLFQWAKNSSQQLIDNLVGEQQLEEASAESKHSIHDDASVNSLEERQKSLPNVQFLSPREIIFETTTSVECRREVYLKNISETVVYYRFECIHPKALENELLSQRSKTAGKKGSRAEVHIDTLSDLLDKKGVDDDETRARSIANQRDNFFCLLQSGELLPNEFIAVPFTFLDSAGGGYYSSTWSLRVWPEQTRVFYNTPSFSGQEITASSTGSLRIHLVAHCMLPDEHGYKRKQLAHLMTSRETETFMQDIFMNCLKRVRLPVRVENLRQREIKVFQEINAAYLAELLTVHGLMPPIYFTTDRLRSFDAIHFNVQRYFARLQDVYVEILQEHDELAGMRGSAKPLPLADGAEWVLGESLRSRLFPEEVLVSQRMND